MSFGDFRQFGLRSGDRCGGAFLILGEEGHFPKHGNRFENRNDRSLIPAADDDFNAAFR